MLSSSTAVVALALVSSALAAPTPTLPGPNAIYAAGGECTIAWTIDTAAKPWTTMNIQLMSGPNAVMEEMRTVATVDATKTSSFNWTCPEVTPPAPIYFYQFSSPSDPTNLQWVTRFTITNADGSSVPAPNATDGINWGYGAFVDTSLYNAPPAYLLTDGQIIAGGANNTNSAIPPLSGAPTGSPSATLPATTPVGTGSGSVASTITTSYVTKASDGSSVSKSASSPSTTSSVSSASPLVDMGASWAVLFSALMAGVGAAAL